MSADKDSKTISLSKAADRMRKKRAGETVEKRLQRLQQESARRAVAIEKESPEQRQQRLQKKAQRDKVRREKESPEKRKQRLYKKAKCTKVSRESQSPEKQQQWLKKQAERAALRRESESIELRQLRLKKEAERVALKRLHQSEEQRQQRRKVEAARIAAKRNRERQEEHQKLQQQVECGDRSEHQERLVPYHGSVQDWMEKYLFYDKKEHWFGRKYFVLKRVCPCCKDLETEFEKENKKRIAEFKAEALAFREKMRQKLLLDPECLLPPNLCSDRYQPGK